MGLAKQLETDPRACISSFFTKIQVADEEYKSAFYSELEAFKERIKKRAAEKIAEAMEEERLANLGPGGLDPADVFESLPRSMQSASSPRTSVCCNKSSRSCRRRKPDIT